MLSKLAKLTCFVISTVGLIKGTTTASSWAFTIASILVTLITQILGYLSFIQYAIVIGLLTIHITSAGATLIATALALTVLIFEAIALILSIQKDWNDDNGDNATIYW